MTKLCYDKSATCARRDDSQCVLCNIGSVSPWGAEPMLRLGRET